MKYGQRILAKAKKEAERGLSDIQLCQALGIGITTIYTWKQKYEEFREVLIAAKEVADQHIVNATYKASQWTEIIEEHKLIRDDGIKKVQEIKTIKKTIPPNPALAIFWLKNRQPDTWRDRREDVIALVSKDDLKKSAEEINAIINNLEEKKE